MDWTSLCVRGVPLCTGCRRKDYTHTFGYIALESNRVFFFHEMLLLGFSEFLPRYIESCTENAKPGDVVTLAMKLKLRLFAVTRKRNMTSIIIVSVALVLFDLRFEYILRVLSFNWTRRRYQVGDHPFTLCSCGYPGTVNTARQSGILAVKRKSPRLFRKPSSV